MMKSFKNLSSLKIENNTRKRVNKVLNKTIVIVLSYLFIPIIAKAVGVDELEGAASNLKATIVGTGCDLLLLGELVYAGYSMMQQRKIIALGLIPVMMCLTEYVKVRFGG